MFRPTPLRTPAVTHTLPAALTALALISGCGVQTSTGDPNRVDVVAAFYPLQFVTERVGGTAVAVTPLAKPGVEPHDLELNPEQVGQITEAELVVYLAGFQPAVDDAVALQTSEDRVFDVATAVELRSGAGHDHAAEPHPDGGDGSEGASGGHGTDGHVEESDGQVEESGAAPDPHLWLDPIRLATVGDALADRLAAADPDQAAGYRQRAAALRAELERLDQDYATGLKTCQRREVFVSHTAFGYLTDRYELEQISVSGLTPEDEPSARQIGTVVTEVRAHGATTIFFETLVSPKVAETIANETGIRTMTLDPIEGLRPGDTGDYFSVMRDNLANLRTALGCT